MQTLEKKGTGGAVPFQAGKPSAGAPLSQWNLLLERDLLLEKEKPKRAVSTKELKQEERDAIYSFLLDHKTRKNAFEALMANCGDLCPEDAHKLFYTVFFMSNGKKEQEAAYEFSWGAPESIGADLRKMAARWRVENGTTEEKMLLFSEKVKRLPENEMTEIIGLVIGHPSSNYPKEGIGLVEFAPKKEQHKLWKLGAERVKSHIDILIKLRGGPFGQKHAINILNMAWKLPRRYRAPPIEAAIELAALKNWEHLLESALEMAIAMPEKTRAKLAEKLVPMLDRKSLSKLVEEDPIACSSSRLGVWKNGYEEIKAGITIGDQRSAIEAFCLIPLVGENERAELMEMGIANAKKMGWGPAILIKAGKMMHAVPEKDWARAVRAIIGSGMCIVAFDAKEFGMLVKSAPLEERDGLYGLLGKRAMLALGSKNISPMMAAVSLIPILPKQARAALIEEAMNAMAGWKRDEIENVSELIPLAEDEKQAGLRESYGKIMKQRKGE